MRIVERKEVGQALKAFCDKYDTYAEAAKKLGITPSQLSSALNKPKSVVPAKALKKLGFKFEAVYLGKDLPPVKAHVPSALTKALIAAAKPKRAAGAESLTARHGPNADDVVRAGLKKAKPRVRKPVKLPLIEDVQPVEDVELCVGGHTPDWSGLRRAYGECKVCGTVVEPSNPPVAVAVVAPGPELANDVTETEFAEDEQSMSVLGSEDDPNPVDDYAPEPEFDENGYPIYRC